MGKVHTGSALSGYCSAMLITNSRPLMPRQTLAEPTQAEGKPLKGRIGSAVSGGVSVMTTGAAVIEAFPQFIYPSVLNATALEKSAIMATLDRLPLHHVGEIDTISMVESIVSKKPGWVVYGNAKISGSPIISICLDPP